jgi:hypothetical protein
MAKRNKSTLSKIADFMGTFFVLAIVVVFFGGLIYVMLHDHGAPACSADNAAKAAEAYKACVQMQGHPGEMGGYSCGLQAYKTYCEN